MPATAPFLHFLFLHLHNFHALHISMVKNPALPTENFQQGGNGNFDPILAVGAVTGIYDLEKSGPIQHHKTKSIS